MPYKRVVIVPYKMGSKSARALKEALVADGIRCFRKRNDSNFIAKTTDLVIYYGGTASLPRTVKALNSCRNIAQNKLSTLRVLADHGLSTVPWTNDHATALTWLDAGKLLVGRRTLTGHSGQGIELYHADDVQGDCAIGGAHECCPLFTQYIKKAYECRLHVFNGSVMDAQIKRKQAGAETNTLIRNHHTGWVYCREGYTPSEVCKKLAVDAVNALELDFGAVDIIYNKHYDTYYVLEVNTAPGLEGQTLINYVQEIKNVVDTH